MPSAEDFLAAAIDRAEELTRSIVHNALEVEANADMTSQASLVGEEEEGSIAKGESPEQGTDTADAVPPSGSEPRSQAAGEANEGAPEPQPEVEGQPAIADAPEQKDVVGQAAEAGGQTPQGPQVPEPTLAPTPEGGESEEAARPGFIPVSLEDDADFEEPKPAEDPRRDKPDVPTPERPPPVRTPRSPIHQLREIRFFRRDTARRRRTSRAGPFRPTSCRQMGKPRRPPWRSPEVPWCGRKPMVALTVGTCG